MNGQSRERIEIKFIKSVLSLSEVVLYCQMLNVLSASLTGVSRSGNYLLLVVRCSRVCK